MPHAQICVQTKIAITIIPSKCTGFSFNDHRVGDKTDCSILTDFAEKIK